MTTGLLIESPESKRTKTRLPPSRLRRLKRVMPFSKTQKLLPVPMCLSKMDKQLQLPLRLPQDPKTMDTTDPLREHLSHSKNIQSYNCY